MADTSPVTLDQLGRVHLVGIGGAGVSVIARLLRALGVHVQGSDAVESPTLAALRADGVPVWVGHDASHVIGPDGVALVDTVVVSTAVRDINPELAAARAAGIRVLHRSEALAALMARGRAIAVAGAHGKTTTSAMIVAVLAAAGVDASYAIGSTVCFQSSSGVVNQPGGHLGIADVLVAEADESDGSFLNYAPDIAVVTNVEPDHLDHYGTREAFEQAFVQFAGRVRSGGWLVACADDAGAARLADAHRAAGGNVVTYGRGEADVRVVGTESPRIAGGPFGALSRPLEVKVPGEHNLLNAAAAVTVAALMAVDPAAAVAGAAAFLGTGRRFELRGEVGGVRVIDDYAHHPTEIAATLAAARTQAGVGRVLVLFQPHLYSRTKTFAAEFAAVLSAADEVVVTGVYRSREDVDPTVTASTIADLVDETATGGEMKPIEDRFEAATAIATKAKPGDLVLTVGAGDVTELAPVILDALSQRQDPI